MKLIILDLYEKLLYKAIKLTVFILLIMTIIMLFFNCSGSIDNGISIKRAEFTDSKPYDKKIFKEYRLRYLKVNKSTYIHSDSESFTLKGSFMELNNKKNELVITPDLNGEYSIRFEMLILKKKGYKKNITVSIIHNKKKIVEKSFMHNGIYLLAPAETLSLSKKDSISIIAEGNGVLTISNPIFFKKKPLKKRNYIFLICADTVAATHLSLYGYPRNTSPNIVKFAEDSVVFKNAYAQSSWTLPSHMSLFTSLYEHKHGIKKKGKLSLKIDFLVENLSPQFMTRSMNGGGYIKSIFGFYRGFDYYKSYGKLGPRPNSSKNLFLKAFKDLKINDLPNSFYFLHTYQAHTPHQPPAKFLKLFNKNHSQPIMNTPFGVTIKKSGIVKLNKIRKNVIDLYDAEIRTFDHFFGDFLSKLKKMGIYKQSMIILFSDHGEEFYEHGNWGHSHTVYNECVRVPLVIKFPQNVDKGSIVKTQVGLIDIMPTIMNYYNVSYNPKKLDGHHLQSFINKATQKRPIISSNTNSIYTPKNGFKVAYFKDGQKIIYNIPIELAKQDKLLTNEKTFEFFNLVTDPGEMVNIYKKQIQKIKKLQFLFRSIISHGILHFKTKGNKAIIDKKTSDALKSLGYL